MQLAENVMVILNFIVWSSAVVRWNYAIFVSNVLVYVYTIYFNCYTMHSNQEDSSKLNWVLIESQSKDGYDDYMCGVWIQLIN